MSTQPTFFQSDRWNDRLEDERRVTIIDAGPEAIDLRATVALGVMPAGTSRLGLLGVPSDLFQTTVYAATGALVFNLPYVISARSAEERVAAWTRLMKAVAVAIGVDVGATALKKAIMAALNGLKKQMFEIAHCERFVQRVLACIVSASCNG